MRACFLALFYCAALTAQPSESKKSSDKRDEILQQSAAEAAAAANSQMEATIRAANQAKQDAELLRQRADSAAQSTHALIIVQGFGFAALISGYIASALSERRKNKQTELRHVEEMDLAKSISDHQAIIENKVAVATDKQEAKLNIIHGLVDGALTAAKEAELMAHERIMVLLQSIIATRKELGLSATDDTVARMAETEAEIDVLKTDIAKRKLMEPT